MTPTPVYEIPIILHPYHGPMILAFMFLGIAIAFLCLAFTNRGIKAVALALTCPALIYIAYKMARIASLSEPLF